MGLNKKYYWLKLHPDFFKSKEVQLLRKIAGGDTFTIIYLKMLLLSLPNDGIIYYEGLDKTLADELALELNEDADNVSVTLRFLFEKNLMTEVSEDEFLLVKVNELCGSETDGARRVRKYRESKKVSNSNDVMLQSNTKALHCNTDVTTCNKNANTEKEKEKEIEIENKDILRDFGIFWEAYPNKKSKKAAEKAFLKLNPNDDLVDVMLTAIGKQKLTDQWRRDNGAFIPHPATWLNGRRWEDEAAEVETRPTNWKALESLGIDWRSK